MVSVIMLASLVIAFQHGSKDLPWQEVCPTPPGFCPQGLADADGRLLLSAYRGPEQSSSIFCFRRVGGVAGFTELFVMPDDARHTSGLAAIPGRPDRLFAIDYRSGRIYLLDLPRSCRDRRAVVLASCPTGLQRPSACCVAQLGDGQWRLMISEFRPLGPGHNALFAFHAGTGRPGEPNAVEPYVVRDDRHAPFLNRGYPQGAKFREGLVYETGNRPLGPSYLVRYRLDDALIAGRIPPSRSPGVDLFEGPGWMIEDLEFFDGALWVTDEKRGRLYRVPSLVHQSQRDLWGIGIMKMRNFGRSLLILAASTGLAHGQPVLVTRKVNQEVQVVMKDVDDLGFVLILNSKKASLAEKCEWRPTALGGEPGQASVNLRHSLVPGDNYIVVGCYNKTWPYFGGKYAYDFRINFGRAGGELTEFWSSKDSVPDPDGRHSRKLIFAKVVLAHLDKRSGDVSLSEDLPDAAEEKVNVAVLEFENALLRNGEDIARGAPDWAEKVASLVLDEIISNSKGK